MKSLTQQIIELMPEERTQENLPFENSPEIYGNQRIESYKKGFNQARTEMINKIPEILSLIRGEVEKMNEYHTDIGGRTVVFTDDYIRKDDLLEKLK